MAKFSQTFLQGLLQPTYQQGLFDVARSVGQAPGVMGLQRQREEEQTKLQSVITGLPTIERIAQIRSMAATMAVTKPDRAKALTNAANNMQKQYDAEQTRQDQLLTGVAQTIASDVNIENIAEYVANLEIEDYRKPALIKQATDQRNIFISEKANEDARTLSDFHQTFIEKNRTTLDKNPLFQQYMSVLERTEGEFGVGEKLTAVTAIKKLVNAEVERQGDAAFKSAAVEAQSTGYINTFIAQDSISEFVWGRDAVEAAREVFNSEEFRDEFVRFVGAEYEQSPNITAEVAVKNALDFMGEKYSDKLEFGRLMNIEEDVSVKAQREDVITFLMNNQDLSRKEAIRELNKRQAALAIEKQQPPPSDPPPLPPPLSPPPTTTQTITQGRNPRLFYPTVTPEQAQRRTAVSETLSNYNTEAAQRRAEQRLFTGGRPIKN